MSRSYRHTPVANPYGCASEKSDKKLWHGKMRAAVRVCLHNFEPDEILLPHEREVSNVWAFGKDGKWRFDPNQYPRLMRK